MPLTSHSVPPGRPTPPESWSTVAAVGATVLGVLLGHAPLAEAADATAFPPRFRADVSLGYQGRFEQVGLEEAGETRAIREVLGHDLTLDAEVAVWTGVALRLALPITARQDLRWPGARAMRVDPLTGEGSYEGGEAISPDPLTTRGVQGVWIGLAASPFRQGWSRSLPMTMRFDLAVRTPGKNGTMYGERRGAAPGGAALQLGGAFSYVTGRVDTWLSMAYTREFAATDVAIVPRDDASTASGPDQTIKAGDRIEARIGGVTLLRHDPRTGQRTGIGVWAGLDWIGEDRRPSGYWLPDVLDSTEATPVVASDRLAARFGVDVELDPLPQLGVRIGLDAGYLTPRFEEHLYPVSTDAQSFSLGWTVTLIGRVRLRDEPTTDGPPDLSIAP